MAAATVIHFGSDDLSHVPALRDAGYEVRESHSLDRLRVELESDEEVDAVIVSEAEPSFAERAAVLVRERTGAPLILFRRPDVSVDESLFDRVFSWFKQEAHWLFDTAVLVMQSKELRAASKRMRGKSRRMRMDSETVR